MFPLRSELAMTFTGTIPRSVKSRAVKRAVDWASAAGMMVRNILILRLGASIFAKCAPSKLGARISAADVWPLMPQASPWWIPDIHADRQPFLRARGRVLTALRHYLEVRDFAEVETAILQVSPGNEAPLHAFATELVAPDGARQ